MIFSILAVLIAVVIALSKPTKRKVHSRNHVRRVKITIQLNSHGKDDGARVMPRTGQQEILVGTGAASAAKRLTANGSDSTRPGNADSSSEGTLRGLVIREPWVSMILSGQKTWEMRSTKINIRGQIALIKKGTSTVVGVADLVNVRGPLDDSVLKENVDKHHVDSDLFKTQFQKHRYAWILENITPLNEPIPYRHRPGAQNIVRLDQGCQEKILASLSRG